MGSNTKQDILTAAKAIVAASGAPALTVRAVAAQAGCSTIGVYTHFQHRDGLLAAVVIDGFDSFDKAFAESDTIEDGIARLTEGSHRYREWALENPALYTLMFAPLTAGFVDHDAVVERAWVSQRMYQARVKHAVERGDIESDDIDALNQHLWASVHGHLMLELGSQHLPHDVDARQRFDAGVRWLLRGVAP